MSKYKKKNSGKGSDKQMLAALQSPVAGQDAEQPVTYGAVTHDMNTTTAGPDEPKFELQSDEQPIANERSTLPETSSEARPNVMHGTLGQRLRAAREIRGWKAGDVAGRLRLPIQIIQAIEAEQYDKIGQGIYLRGYLKSYARLVDVPTVLVDSVTSERSHEPALVASGTISHSRYLYQRYSVSALYLILTGVIIVPAVLLAMRASMQPAATQLTPLDAPASSIATDNAPGATAEPVGTTAGSTSTALETAPAADSASAAPLVASLAPFSALSHTDNSNHVETRAPVTGAHSLKLTLKEASWVEVTSAGGDKLEFGLLPAGSSRTYSSDKALDVRLGNCNGAEVEADGKIQDLTAYRRANVAHFKLFAGGEPISN